MIGDWETAGKWPEALRNVIFSMIPKPKAETEAGLRPIGLLPCVYRAWMAIRKSQCKESPLRLHDGKHVGAAALVARTGASVETAFWLSSIAVSATSGWNTLWPVVERCGLGTGGADRQHHFWHRKRRSVQEAGLGTTLATLP